MWIKAGIIESSMSNLISYLDDAALSASNMLYRNTVQHSTNVLRFSNELVCTATAVELPFYKFTKPLTHLIQKREMMKLTFLFLYYRRSCLSGWTYRKTLNQYRIHAIIIIPMIRDYQTKYVILPQQKLKIVFTDIS